jgi:hypothetical protein
MQNGHETCAQDQKLQHYGGVAVRFMFVNHRQTDTLKPPLNEPCLSNVAASVSICERDDDTSRSVAKRIRSNCSGIRASVEATRIGRLSG